MRGTRNVRETAFLRKAPLELSRGYLEDLTRGRTRVCHYSVCPGGEVLIDQTEGGSES